MRKLVKKTSERPLLPSKVVPTEENQCGAPISGTILNKVLEGDNEMLLKLLETSNVDSLKEWISSRQGRQLDIIVREHIEWYNGSEYNGFEDIWRKLSGTTDPFGLSLLGSLIDPFRVSQMFGLEHQILEGVSSQTRLELIQLMLERKADPNFPSFVLVSPMILICCTGEVEILKALAEKGGHIGYEMLENWEEVERSYPDWRQKTPDWGSSPIHQAAFDLQIGQIKLLREMDIDGKTLSPHPAWPQSDAMLKLAEKTRNPADLEAMEEIGFNPKVLYPREDGCFTSALFLAISQAPDYAVKVLEKAQQYRGPFCQKQIVVFDYEGIELDSSNDLITFYTKNKHQRIVKTTLIEHVVRSGNAELLELPILRHLVETKWECFGRKYWLFDITITSMYFVSTIVLLLYWPVHECTGSRSTGCSISGKISMTFLFIFATLATFFYFWAEVYELRRIGLRSYLYEMENWSDICLLVLTSISLIFLVLDALMDTDLLTPAALSGAFMQLLFGFKFTNLFGISSSFGPLVVMLQKMFFDSFQICMLLAAFLLVHVNFFAVLIRYSGADTDITYWDLIPTLYLWLFGDWNLPLVAALNPWIEFALGAGFFTFTLLLVIVMLNTLIAKMGNTFSNVDDHADTEWLMEVAKFSVKYQARLSTKGINFYKEAIRQRNKKVLKIAFDEGEKVRIAGESNDNSFDNDLVQQFEQRLNHRLELCEQRFTNELSKIKELLQNNERLLSLTD